jgi:hypothetical protein
VLVRPKKNFFQAAQFIRVDEIRDPLASRRVLLREVDLQRIPKLCALQAHPVPNGPQYAAMSLQYWKGVNF